MTGKDLLTALSGIDGKYIEEAAAPMVKVHLMTWYSFMGSSFRNRVFAP